MARVLLQIDEVAREDNATISPAKPENYGGSGIVTTGSIIGACVVGAVLACLWIAWCRVGMPGKHFMDAIKNQKSRELRETQEQELNQELDLENFVPADEEETLRRVDSGCGSEAVSDGEITKMNNEIKELTAAIQAAKDATHSAGSSRTRTPRDYIASLRDNISENPEKQKIETQLRDLEARIDYLAGNDLTTDDLARQEAENRKLMEMLAQMSQDYSIEDAEVSRSSVENGGSAALPLRAI